VSGPCWFGQIELARVQPKKLVWLLAILIASYAVLLSAAWASGGIRVAEQWLSDGARAGMKIFGDRSLSRAIEVSLEGPHVVYDYTLISGTEKQNAQMKHPAHAQNLVLFAALVLAVPGLVGRQRALALAIGLAAIFLVDVLIVMGDFLSIEEPRFSLAGPDNVWLPLQYVTRVLRYSQPTGGAFMVPVFVWGLVLMGPFRRQVIESLREETPAAKKGKKKQR
jgi:hypothetical protein